VSHQAFIYIPSLPAPVAAPYHVAVASDDQLESLRWNSTDAPGWRRDARTATATKDRRWDWEAITRCSVPSLWLSWFCK
jgi:hypothetical protein